MVRSFARFCAPRWVRLAASATGLAFAVCFAHSATAQAAAPPQPDSAQAQPKPPSSASPKTKQPQETALSEDQIKTLLVGKTLYLRNGYLENALSFDEHGKLIGHSPQGSYTLCVVEIDKVHLSRHTVELEGQRFGLHFLGALPNEDPTHAADRVRITPKKKYLRITIDRELVVIPKKKKEKKDQTVTPGAAPAQPSDADEDKAEMASAPEAERPASASSVTTTTSQAHANKLLRDAIDQVFSQGLDDRMIASLPDFWRLYYDAVSKQIDFRPSTPGIYPESAVDHKPVLLSKIEAPSNDFAQTNGIAGMALYHAIIGTDGKPEEVVVARPIGFGLDENAADTIRKATFQPATKDGKPVPVMVDLVVQFRIFDNRTDQPAKPDADEASAPKLPGPYSVARP